MEDRKAGTKYCSERCSDWACSRKGPYSARTGRRCPYCGEAIPAEARINQRFCSDSCAAKSHQALRRIRKAGLPAEVIDRIEIFDRDNWTCHLCANEVNAALSGQHPFAASLDHIISLAHPESPGHIWENVTSKNARVTQHDWSLYRALRERRLEGERWPQKRPVLPLPLQLSVF
jgi:predicted nucleic acid-binding Zn ribbon protein